MKKTASFLRNCGNLVKRNVGKLALGTALLAPVLSHAQTSSIQTALETSVTDAKTAAEAILGLVVGVMAAFVILKLGKRAVNKA